MSVHVIYDPRAVLVTVLYTVGLKATFGNIDFSIWVGSKTVFNFTNVSGQAGLEAAFQVPMPGDSS